MAESANERRGRGSGYGRNTDSQRLGRGDRFRLRRRQTPRTRTITPGRGWSRRPHRGVFACWGLLGSRVRGVGGGSDLFSGCSGWDWPVFGGVCQWLRVVLPAAGGSGRVWSDGVGSRRRGAVGGWFMGVLGWLWGWWGAGLVRLVGWCRGVCGRDGPGWWGCGSCVGGLGGCV